MILTLQLSAQTSDAWDKQVSTWQSVRLFIPRVASGFTVVSTNSEDWLRSDFPQDKRLSRLVGELGVWPLAPAAMKSLWTRQGWGPEVRWALIDPDFKVVAHGKGEVNLDALLDVMRSKGWRPVKERRAEFLREHPEAGELLADQAMEAAVSALGMDPRITFSDEGPKVTQADALPAKEEEAIYGELATALRAFQSVDGWERSESIVELCHVFETPVFRSVKLLEVPLTQLQKGIKAELSRRPDRSSLWTAWVPLLTPDEIQGSEDWISGFEGAPGQLWPPAGYAKALSLGHTARKDYVGLERLAASALGRLLASVPKSGASNERQEAIKTWTLIRFGALLGLERYSDARELLSSTRPALGKQWRELANEIGDSKKLPIPELEQKEIEKTVHLEPLDEQPIPSPQPLKLALFGDPEWKQEWNQVRTDPVFDEFNPLDELAWTTLSETEQHRFRALGKVAEACGWLLLKGEEVLAHGSTLPATPQLAATIHGHLTARLTALDAFLGSYPERMDARKLRLTELRRRMPHGRLEARLLGDARFLSESFHPDQEWKPSLPGWESEAKRALPEIEARLRRWPNSLADWQLWLDWSWLHPGRPAPGALLATLPVFNEQILPGRAQLPLPEPAFKAVAERLRARKDWVALADWCRQFWDSGVKEHLTFLLWSSANLTGKRVHRWETALSRAFRLYIEPYQIALIGAGRLSELQRLNVELEVLRPGLSKLK